MKNLLFLSLAVTALAGCGTSANKSEAPGPASQATGVAPSAARISDERILADRRTIDSLQGRLRSLNEAGVTQGSYPLAKAQCWLDSAKTQYHENDRTGYIEEALTESARIIQALERDKTAKAGYETPLVARSTRLRDDLWSRLGAFKSQDALLACNARTVACAEVRLVRAGHAEEQTGWRAATPHVQMVEDAVRKAAAEAASCQQQAALVSRAVAAAPPVAPVPPPAPPVVQAAPTPPAAPVVPVIQTVTRETYIILGDTLFRFDKSGQTDMLPGGLQSLDAIAQRLKAYQTIQTVTIVGHTDRLGTDAYNDPLSQSRAAAVKAYLESIGVKASRMEAVGKGKREPVTGNCSNSLPRDKLIDCLQPDRRVSIEVTGVVK